MVRYSHNVLGFLTTQNGCWRVPRRCERKIIEHGTHATFDPGIVKLKQTEQETEGVQLEIPM